MSDWEMPLGVCEGISTQKVGDELLLYDKRTHKAFCLNASAAIVWELANGARALDELADLASAALHMPISRDLVTFILDELGRKNLLQSTAAPNTAPMSRRSALRKLGACAALLPVIASISAPTAAQAYSGCVDCAVQPGRPGPNIRRRTRRPSQ